MKAKELGERTVEELQGLERDLERQMFDYRFKNYTNRLDDTSLIRKTRRDLARVKTFLNAKKAAPAGEASAKPAT
jgi:large subunit ribosomal protein L29